MKQLQSLFFSIAALGMCLSLSLGPATAQDVGVSGPPKIACDAPTFDFGNKDNSTSVKHTFVIKNNGVSTLNISRVKPACGCTVANISSKVLEPGQTAEITANLSLKGRTGRQTKPMTVYSNDPAAPQFRLTLQGTAVSEVTISPTAISLGSLNEGQQVTREVSIKNSSATPMKVTKVESSNNTVTHELVTIKEGFEYKISVTNSKFLPPGRITDSLTVTTDNPKMPTQRISVYGTVLDKITVSPNPLVIPESKTAPVSRKLYVRAGSVKAFNILGATWPGTDAKVSVSNLGARGFTINLDNVNATTAINGTSIVLKTDVEGLEEMKVPVQIRAAQ